MTSDTKAGVIKFLHTKKKKKKEKKKKRKENALINIH